MTEIDFPSGSAPTSPSRGPSRRVIVIAIVVILIIGGGFIGFIILSTPGSDHISSLLWSRSGIDPDLYPSYYYGEFELTTDHIDDTTPPDILFTVSSDTGSDSGDVYTYVGVYDLDVSTFNGMDWTERDLYMVDYINEVGDISDYIDLPQVAGKYTWVVAILYEDFVKSDVWSTNIDVYLRYNWILTE